MAVMAEVTMSLKRAPVNDEQPCGVCRSMFVPVEDSGARVLSLKSGQQEFAFLLCGGCHSKWLHGAVTTMRSVPAPASS
jgi:hypothetical protein